MLQPRSNVHHSTHQSLIKTSHTALPPVCRDGKHHQAVPKRRDVEMREALSMVVMHIRVGGAGVGEAGDREMHGKLEHTFWHSERFNKCSILSLLP